MPKSSTSAAVRIITLEELRHALPELHCRTYQIDNACYTAWLRTFYPTHEEIGPALYNKKKLELFLTHTLLDVTSAMTFLDAAGGKYTYAHRVTASSMIQDLYISDRLRELCRGLVTLVAQGLDKIEASDTSVDAICCHHSFEHFQGASDQQFIKEIQRVLSVCGRAAIVPIFIADKFTEISNDPAFAAWSSEASHHIIDLEETLPGKKRSGNFARLYDAQSFRERVLQHIDTDQFDVELLEVLDHNGAAVPDMRQPDHWHRSLFNVPYRILVIRRREAVNLLN